MDWSKTASASEERQTDIDDQLRIIEDAARMCRECERCEETWRRLPSGEVERCDCFVRYLNAVKNFRNKAPRDWDEHMTDGCWNTKQQKTGPLMPDGRFSELRKLQHFLTEDILPRDAELNHVSQDEWESILSGLPATPRENLQAVFRLAKNGFAEAM